MEPGDKLLLTEFMIYFCQKDWLGRAKFKPLRQLKRLPTPSEIRRVIFEEDNTISGAEVIAAIKVMCKIMGYVCPLVGEKYPDNGK